MSEEKNIVQVNKWVSIDKKQMKKSFTIMLMILFIGCFGYYINNNKEDNNKINSNIMDEEESKIEKTLSNIGKHYKYNLDIKGIYTNNNNDLIIILKDNTEEYNKIADYIGNYLKENILGYKSEETGEELLLMFIDEDNNGYYIEKYFNILLSKIVSKQYNFVMQIRHGKDEFKYDNNVKAFNINYLTDLKEIDSYSNLKSEN